MANDGTIASKLQLDGEQQYKKALNDAYRSLRVLRSELKAETAEMGRNATAQDKARAKMASLQKQIAEQQKVVKTLEKALADSKKEYANNQEVQDKWAEKLNKAREALANMQNALGQTQDDLSKFGSSMKEVANNSGEAMQTVVSFNDAMKSIGSIVSGVGSSLSGIFSATVDTMKDMVDEMFSLMSQAWAAAGDWQQIQTIWGGDLESIERVYTAMSLQGIDAGEVTSGIQKFITNVHNGNKDTMAALEQLHLSESQFSSHWDFFVATMDKASMFKGNEGYNLMTALFGDKKGAGMTDMLKNWREAMNRYQQDVEETGLALSSPQIEALDEVSHKITEIQQLWETIKTNIGAKLSEVLNMDQLSEDTLAILRDIGSLLSGKGDRKEITFKLEQDIKSLLTSISNALGNLSGFLKELGGDLEQSKNPLVSFVGKLINSLSNILDWISKNSGTIIDWLNKLLPVMGVNKISEATTGKGIGDWLTDIMKLGLEVKVLGKVFGTSAGAAVGETAATFGAGIGAAILKAVPPLAFLGTLFHVSPTSDEIGNNDLLDENGRLTNEAIQYGYSLNDKGELIPPWANNQGSGSTAGTTGEPSPISATAAQRAAAEEFWDALRLTGAADSDKLLEAFDGNKEVVSKLSELIIDLGESENGKGWETFEDLPSNWFNDISGALKNLTQDNYKGAGLEDLPGKIGSAVAGAVKLAPVNITVNVDGEPMYKKVNQSLGSLMARA